MCKRRLLTGSAADRAVAVLIEKPDPRQGHMLVGHDRLDNLSEHGRRAFRLRDRKNYRKKVHDMSSC